VILQVRKGGDLGQAGLAGDAAVPDRGASRLGRQGRAGPHDRTRPSAVCPARAVLLLPLAGKEARARSDGGAQSEGAAGPKTAGGAHETSFGQKRRRKSAGHGEPRRKM
jgi:hypothetical protein